MEVNATRLSRGSQVPKTLSEVEGRFRSENEDVSHLCERSISKYAFEQFDRCTHPGYREHRQVQRLLWVSCH